MPRHLHVLGHFSCLVYFVNFLAGDPSSMQKYYPVRKVGVIFPFKGGLSMTGISLFVVFALAIVVMIVAISKFGIHPFLSLMGTSLLLAIVVQLPLAKIPGIIGAGFSGTFSSIGIVIILGALIGLILERTGAAIRLADAVIRCVGEKHPELEK